MVIALAVRNLGSAAGRVVRDATGLDGYYDLTLQFGDDVTVFTALREQLGLTLEPGRAPLPVLLVERIERPSPN